MDCRNVLRCDMSDCCRFQKPILTSDSRTALKQEQHTKDTAEFLIKDLKVLLNSRAKT